MELRPLGSGAGIPSLPVLLRGRPPLQCQWWGGYGCPDLGKAKAVSWWAGLRADRAEPRCCYPLSLGCFSWAPQRLSVSGKLRLP